MLGDLSLVLPKRLLDGIIEMIYALDKIAPGTANDDTLLYGVEVKFYNMEVEVDENLESKHKGLYIIGDGSGYGTNVTHYLVLEACEYKRHFLEYTPYYTVILNIDLDNEEEGNKLSIIRLDSINPQTEDNYLDEIFEMKLELRKWFNIIPEEGLDISNEEKIRTKIQNQNQKVKKINES